MTRMVETLSQLLDTALPDDYELVVVDDDSLDRTWEIAEHLIDCYPHLQVIRYCYCLELLD